MQLIDANVILRYLLCDQEAMAEKAREVIHHGAFTTPEVLAEVVYVLSGVYQCGREEISQMLQVFLTDVRVQNVNVIRYALNAFAATKLDFVDCILLGYHHVLGTEVFTFDRKLNRLLEAE